MSPGHAHSSKRTRIVILVAVVVAALVTGLALLPDTFSADADASASVTKVSTSSTARGDVGRNLPVTKPKISCTELLQKDFGALDDAATSVASASVVAKGDANAYEYCDVKGTVAPQIQFELRLPTKTYRQRYLQEGCGGYCGMVGVSAQPAASTGCAPVTDGSFALGQDDQGHVSTSGTSGGSAEVWATNPQLKVDFGYRSEHAFATAAKAITKAFYGAEPTYSYYDGCSDGGRETLMEVQRYPGDFSAALVGAPAFNQTALNAMQEAYLSTIDFRADGSTILPASKLGTLHKAVLAKCADPKLNNHLIQDPATCAFDPASLKCADNKDSSSCLTSEQVDVVRKAYAGATAPDGTHLYTGGQPYGSETAWEGLFIPKAGQGQSSVQLYGIGLGFLRWVGKWEADPTLKLDASLFTVDTFKAYQREVSGIYDATDPDLTKFHEAGGKLIQWHGLTDPNIPPTGTRAYRQAVIDTMGQDKADDFYRLYLFPGVNHCGGGDGPDSFDLLSKLISWRETGRTPGAVIASRTSGGNQPGGPAGGQLGGGDTKASASAGSTEPTVAYTRPVHPYPQLVAYDGSGDKKDAANYRAYMPDKLPDDHFKWAGSFSSGYQEWCETKDGKSMSCSRHEP
ncbi:tannase/feruloyl esterase family alpha/beta hydrolase [Streptomyces sp. NPDC051665]|uniref:tannase/feruloyl esterase family alpha/beta hydrolase n=1 Tax=Streptomyces sp. NPDC051665 TaxID=3154647 RepID=UPI00342421C8